jgi:hypothetical protein
MVKVCAALVVVVEEWFWRGHIDELECETRPKCYRKSDKKRRGTSTQKLKVEEEGISLSQGGSSTKMARRAEPCTCLT